MESNNERLLALRAALSKIPLQHNRTIRIYNIFRELDESLSNGGTLPDDWKPRKYVNPNR